MCVWRHMFEGHPLQCEPQLLFANHPLPLEASVTKNFLCDQLSRIQCWCTAEYNLYMYTRWNDTDCFNTGLGMRLCPFTGLGTRLCSFTGLGTRLCPFTGLGTRLCSFTSPLSPHSSKSVLILLDYRQLCGEPTQTWVKFWEWNAKQV